MPYQEFRAEFAATIASVGIRTSREVLGRQQARSRVHRHDGLEAAVAGDRDTAEVRRDAAHRGERGESSPRVPADPDSCGIDGPGQEIVGALRTREHRVNGELDVGDATRDELRFLVEGRECPASRSSAVSPAWSAETTTKPWLANFSVKKLAMNRSAPLPCEYTTNGKGAPSDDRHLLECEGRRHEELRKGAFEVPRAGSPRRAIRGVPDVDGPAALAVAGHECERFVPNPVRPGLGRRNHCGGRARPSSSWESPGRSPSPTNTRPTCQPEQHRAPAQAHRHRARRPHVCFSS